MILKRGKIFWKIADESVVAFDKRQATIYHVYECPSKKSLESMKYRLLHSNPDEYSNWVEVISLAMEVGIKGYGTKVRKSWFNDIESS